MLPAPRSWRDADALREGRLTLLGRVTPCDGEIDWAGREATPDAGAWRCTASSISCPAGFAAVLAESPDERATWWTLVAAHLQDWLTRGRRGHGAAARLEAQTRRVTNLIQLATIFAATSCRPIPTCVGRCSRRCTATPTSLAVTLPRHPGRRLAGGRRPRAVLGGSLLRRRGAREAGSRLASGILWRQLRELVHDDGGLRDRSPARHALVLAEYLELFASTVGQRRGDPRVGAQAGARDDLLSRALAPSRAASSRWATAARSRCPHPGDELMAVAAVVLEEPAFARRARAAGHLAGGDPRQAQPPRLPGARRAPRRAAPRRARCAVPASTCCPATRATS